MTQPFSRRSVPSERAPAGVSRFTATRAVRPRLRSALAGVVAVTLMAGACGGDDDDDTSSRGGSGGSTSGEAGGEGGAGNGGRNGLAGEAGSGAVGGSGGSAGRGGTAGRGGEAGTGGTTGEAGTGGSPAATGGSAQAGEAGTENAGAPALVDPTRFDGEHVFRFDTFGDEQLWTDELRLNEAIQAALDPTTALSLGLKVDADALPAGILDTADLSDPATTVALIGLNAVVGVQGTVDASGNLTRVGITCALCHSNVDDSVMPGIGSRLDGEANHDLDPGAIIALSPALAGNQQALDVYKSWGPGFYDPRFNIDGINDPVVIPSIYGLSGVPLETYTGDGPISYWNQYVGVTQMGAVGTFFDPRIDVAVIYDDDLLTPKLPSLFQYQVSLEPPAVPASDFDAAAADRGQALFNGAAQCSTCHQGEHLTDAGETLHAPAETGMDPTYAQRSATKRYRTTPLRALLRNAPYFHDGSAKTLADVVTHYDATLSLGLTTEQQSDLVEYLKSL